MEEDLSFKSNEELINIYKKSKADLNKTVKKNEKLEEGYIKLNLDIKNLKNDRKTLENFLKIIFPNEKHSSIICDEIGNYDLDILKKMWMINETEKENEFHKILTGNKSESSDLKEKINSLEKELERRTFEFNALRKNLEENKNQLDFYLKNFKDQKRINEEIEKEKSYLMNIIEEKNSEIDRLQNIELEIAESKAKILLFDNEDNKKQSTLKSHSNKEILKENNHDSISHQSSTKNKNILKIGKIYF